MPTMKSFRQQAADKVAARTQALVRVLKKRIDWHLQQWEATKDEAEKSFHHDMVMADDESLLETEADYDSWKRRCEVWNIEMPDIDFKSGLP